MLRTVITNYNFHSLTRPLTFVVFHHSTATIPRSALAHQF